jgi:hypothetical protein
MATPRHHFALAVIALAACSGTLYSLTSGRTDTAPDDVYGCVQNQLTKLGYQRTQYDITDRWYVGKRIDPSARVSSGTFRKRYDLLDTKVVPGADGKSALTVKASTFDEYATTQGITADERSASSKATEDAAAVVRACSS